MKIKGICISLILFIATFNLYSQKDIDHILRKYKNDQGVVNMNFTGDVVKYIKSSNVTLESIIDDVDVLIFENNTDISQKDKSGIQAALTTNKYDMLIDIKNKDHKVSLYTMDKGDFISKVYANVKTTDANVYFIISGKIKLDELGKLNLNFSGSEALKMVGDKK
jgi:hypothetical protein